MTAVTIAGAVAALALMSALLVLDSARRRWRRRFMEASRDATTCAEAADKARLRIRTIAERVGVPPEHWLAQNPDGTWRHGISLPPMELPDPRPPRIEAYGAVPVGLDFEDQSPGTAPVAESFEAGPMQRMLLQLGEYLYRAGFVRVTATDRGRSVVFSARAQVFPIEALPGLSEAARRAEGIRLIEPTEPLERATGLPKNSARG